MTTRKVVVAMSGGVDSSVAAALLVEQGYDVTGMMLRLWSEPGREDSNRCCTPDSMARAKNVAAILNIPFYVLDVKEMFRETVVDFFLNGYAQGVTPNPCLVCNQQIRWGFLLERALSTGADFFATGHYAKLETSDRGRVRLLKAVDQHKDQSYVLAVLDQNQLSRTLLPLGNYPKPEVRELADKFGLPVSSTKDSQDLCFLAGNDYRDFINRHTNGTKRNGEIINQQGMVLGDHEGLAMYTIGQRKGLGISSPEPHYVIDKKPETNQLIVGTKEKLGKNQLHAKSANWISGEAPKKAFSAHVKIRYRSPAYPSEVMPVNEDSFKVIFSEPLRDITPGQAAVIYQGDEVLGSGIIDFS